MKLSEFERGGLVAMFAALALGCFNGCTFTLAYACGIISAFFVGVFVQLQVMGKHGMRLTWYDAVCVMGHVVGGAVFALVGAFIT